MVLPVEDLLNDAGVEYRIIELEARAISVDDVIEYSKEPINPDEICKTILVKQKKQFYALFLRGADQIDFKKLKAVIGKSSIASRDEVREISGVDAGAVCPLLLDVPVIVDERVLGLERLNFGSGNHLYGVEISSGDLSRVLGYRVADFASEIQ
ncbi:MAG: YbaK/EbsC family protein [Candidatus Bathyarchaeota archaeon]|nr:YbaK/EbsC family protein [Candidatus Bathyarchaeota archaeon]